MLRQHHRIFILALDVKACIGICIKFGAADDIDPADVVSAEIDQFVLCHKDVWSTLTHMYIINAGAGVLKT